MPGPFPPKVPKAQSDQYVTTQPSRLYHPSNNPSFPFAASELDPTSRMSHIQQCQETQENAGSNYLSSSSTRLTPGVLALLLHNLKPQTPCKCSMKPFMQIIIVRHVYCLGLLEWQGLLLMRFLPRREVVARIHTQADLEQSQWKVPMLNLTCVLQHKPSPIG